MRGDIKHESDRGRQLRASGTEGDDREREIKPEFDRWPRSYKQSTHCRAGGQLHCSTAQQRYGTSGHKNGVSASRADEQGCNDVPVGEHQGLTSRNATICQGTSQDRTSSPRPTRDEATRALDCEFESISFIS